MLSPLNILKQGMPVTVITGFLGSGKTTLLNHILTNNQGLKIAVLVNEFGDINIDSQLLVSVEENMVALSNGCICCTINDSLVDAVYQVLEQEDKIDYLVVETTGLADPLPIVLTFLGTELRDLTRIDSILTVVDAEMFTSEHFGSEAALSQIIYGDIILFNKTDLVSQEKIQALEKDIAQIKEGARILHSQYGKVPLPLILDIELMNPHFYTDLEVEEHHHHPEHEHHHHHSSHLEVDGFVSVSFSSDRPFNVEKFQEFLSEKMPADVFRAKRIIWFKESQLRHVFQLSGKRYDMNADRWTTEPCNQLVFIGRNLNAQAIQEKLYACLA
jgi:G3E family GTPase